MTRAITISICYREAFQRILVSLVGYISTDQYTTLLQRLGLNDKAYVKYDNFVACFKENEVSPVWSLMAQWLRQASQRHEIYCHNLEVMGSNRDQVNLAVHST